MVLPVRFGLRALESIYFPPGKAANVLRGGFGSTFRSIACTPGCVAPETCENRASCIYAAVFEPRSADGPSGLADPPRPFVFRARHLDGLRVEPGGHFCFDAHLFDYRPATLAYFVAAFRELAIQGMGPRRGSAELVSVTALDHSGVPASSVFAGGRLADTLPEAVRLPLDAIRPSVTEATLRFAAPTELSKTQRLDPPPRFDELFRRIRDRISNLRTLYGEGPLPIDFRALGERARGVTLVGSDLRAAAVERRSSRTGQQHSIGGFVGELHYAGDLTEFLPYLEAARWTGVGRHAVWGNGEMEVVSR